MWAPTARNPHIWLRCSYKYTRELEVKTKKIKVQKSASMKAGDVLDLGPMIINPVTTADKLRFKSSAKKIASVTRKGVITAKKAGKVRITIQSGTKKKVIKITVTQ